MVGAETEKKYLTLILGAGASMPYGFPDGPNLVQRIIGEATIFMGQMVKDNHGFYRRQIQDSSAYEELEACWTYLLNCRGHANLSREKIQELSGRIHQELQLYRPVSIDSYLANLYTSDVPDAKLYVDLCKYYICKIIGSKYIQNYELPLPKNESDDRWVHYLFNAILYYLHRNEYKVDELPIKIITFNYDTFLEQHFRSWIVTSQLLDESTKLNVIELFCKSICHVYGQIGVIADKRDSGTTGKPLGAPFSVEPDEILWTSDTKNEEFNRRIKQNLALKSISRIHLIPRQDFEVADKDGDRAPKASIDVAKEWLGNTEVLLVSGYAFDEDNNNRLNLKELLKGIPHIYGTLKGAGLSLKDEVCELVCKVHSHDKRESFEHFRNVRFDGNEVKLTQGVYQGYRAGFFAKFYDSTTLTLLQKELNLNSLSRKLWPVSKTNNHSKSSL